MSLDAADVMYMHHFGSQPASPDCAVASISPPPPVLQPALTQDVLASCIVVTVWRVLQSSANLARQAS